jgi:structure-specific recognition protein 1
VLDEFSPSPRETIEEKYGGKLQKHYDEPAFRVVSGIFRALSGKKLVGQQG